MKWLIYGALSAILFALWGLFAKLVSYQSPFISNFFLMLATLLTEVVLLLASTRQLKFSKFASIAGIFGGSQSILILTLLLRNQLILVLPFTSAAGAIFFLIVYFTEKPSYKIKQKIFAGAGILLSLFGLLLVATGSMGIASFFFQSWEVFQNFVWKNSSITVLNVRKYFELYCLFVKSFFPHFHTSSFS